MPSKYNENSYTFDSNQSMEMCTSAVLQMASPFNSIFGNNPSRLNNTGKFAINQIGSKGMNSLESIGDSLAKAKDLSGDAKVAYENLVKIMNDVSQFTAARWEALKQRFLLKTSSNFDSDEVISIMMEDEESKAYIAQRMQEILNEDWAAEREVTIHQLTKQVGMLEMKHNLLLSEVNSKGIHTANKHQYDGLEAKLRNQQELMEKMHRQIELKNQEINMLRTHQSHVLNITAPTKFKNEPDQGKV